MDPRQRPSSRHRDAERRARSREESQWMQREREPRPWGEVSDVGSEGSNEFARYGADYGLELNYAGGFDSEERGEPGYGAGLPSEAYGREGYGYQEFADAGYESEHYGAMGISGHDHRGDEPARRRLRGGEAYGGSTGRANLPQGHRDRDEAERRSFRGVGPASYRRSDARVLEDVHERLYDDDQLDASDIEVRCEDGVITLEGSVEDRRMKHRAEDLADSVRGVDRIDNRIQVKERSRETSQRDTEEDDSARAQRIAGDVSGAGGASTSTNRSGSESRG